MAMVKLSGDIIDINGTVGGSVWRVDVCGQHVQAFPRIIDDKQPTSQQRAFTMAKNAWMTHIWQQSEIDKWWIWCYDHPKKSKKGETMYLHPFLAFLSVNIKRILKGKDIEYVPF